MRLRRVPPNNISLRGAMMSATLNTAESTAPTTNPIITEIVSHAPAAVVIFHAARNCGSTTDAENHVLISRKPAVAKIPRAAQRPAGAS